MKAILIDIGNSHVRFRAWTATDSAAEPIAESIAEPISEPISEPDVGPEPLQTLLTVPTAQAVDDPALFRGEMARLSEKHANPPLVLVSVVPALTTACREVDPSLTVIDDRSPLPFLSDVEDLAAVGPDRLCNVAAAWAAGWKDALVVDAGTATTFDVLTGGRFVGGWIAPGMAFAARKLGQEAARLEPQPFGPRPLEPGRNTGDAMAAGAWHVGVGGVESGIRALAGYCPQARIVVTGGLAGYLTGPDRHLDPDWTLRGAAYLAGLAG